MLTALLSMTAAMTGFTPPLGVRPAVTGKRTQMLTLGSAHLSEFKSLTPAMLEPLLDRLQRFAPTIITHENVAGEQCDMMRRAPRYKDAVESYCWDAAPAQKLAGLSQQQAEAEADQTIDAWAATPNRSPSASDRRKLALLFLAAGDRGSARVQWVRLPIAERRVGDGLDAALVDVLARTGRPMNESFDVAAELAARLGLERIHAVDDHSSDAALPHAGKAYEDALTAHFAKFRGSPLLAQYQAAGARVKDGPTLLAFYRFMNEPARLDAQVRGDFGGAFAEPDVAPYGRHYGAWWEVRNMRMLANIRAATAEHPGARVLNVVGASHKPYYDGWARQWGDVDVVALEPVLR